MKKILTLIIVFGILAGVIVYQDSRLKKFRTENKTLNNNMYTLMEGVNTYKTKDSLHAASVGILELRVSEYKKMRSEDARLVEELKIRLKQVEKISSHTTESSYQIASPIRDTVFIYRDVPDTTRYFSYHSPYIHLNGRLGVSSVQIDLTSYDTLVQVIHRVPRQFLFIRYGTKYIKQEVISKNPHTKIAYTEYIELKK